MPTRPMMHYFGGKWKIADWIIKHLPPHKIYAEQYGGAASMLLKKPRSFTEVYNDLNEDLVNLFRVLRHPVQARELARLLELTPYARAEYEHAWQQKLSTLPPVERARCYVVRAHLGFMSFAGRRKGFAGYARWAITPRRGPNNPDTKNPAGQWVLWQGVISSFTERLQGVIIESMPAHRIMPRYDSEATLHYVDPPYVPQTRSSDECYLYEMDLTDHEQLLDLLMSLKGKVVLSGYPNELYQDKLVDWQMLTQPTKSVRNIDKTEALWLSPNAWESRLRQLSLF